MSAEPEFQAHYRCYWCDKLQPKEDIRFVDDKPICRDGDCKSEYYEDTKP